MIEFNCGRGMSLTVNISEGNANKHMRLVGSVVKIAKCFISQKHILTQVCHDKFKFCDVLKTRTLNYRVEIVTI